MEAALGDGLAPDMRTLAQDMRSELLTCGRPCRRPCATA